MDAQRQRINKGKATDACKDMDGNDGGKASARWDGYASRVFVDLCDEEIRKGNRTDGFFNKNGWNNIVTNFKNMTGKDYGKKQMKNHWDNMKNDWKCYEQLMRGETGLGWDHVRTMIAADEEWWDAKIAVNKAFKKFKNKDLYLVKYRYDNLFSDVVASGERARAPNQFGVLLDSHRKDLNDHCDEELDGHRCSDNVDNGSGDSDDIQDLGGNEQATNYSYENSMFPPSIETKRKSHEGNNSGRKKRLSRRKKRLSSTTSLKESIDSLMHVLSSKSIATSFCSVGNKPSVEQCMNLLEAIPGVVIGGPLYCYACTVLCRKEVRSMFARIPTPDARKSWLQYMQTGGFPSC